MSWPMVALGEVIDPVSTWNPRAMGGVDAFNYIDVSTVCRDPKIILSPTLTKPATAPSRARQLVKSGDVLISTVRPNLNAVAVVQDDHDGATASTGFAVMRPRHDHLSHRYLYHWSRSRPFIEDMVRKATGASYPAVSTKIVSESLVPLPPLPEQRRIAAILDAADALRRRRRAAIEMLDTFQAALFAEMFGGSGSELTTLGELCQKIGSGATPRGGSKSYRRCGVPLIRSMNVLDGVFTRKGLVFLDNDQAAKLANVELSADDVLLNITGASVARCSMLPAEFVGGRVNQHVTIIRPHHSEHSWFIAGYLSSPQVKSDLLRIAESGATRQAITKAELERYSIPRPDTGLAKSFRNAIAAHSDIRTAMTTDLAHLETLFAALQSRAFAWEM